MYEKTIRMMTIPLSIFFNKIIEEKASPAPTFTFFKSLATSLTDKGKEQKFDTPKTTMNMVKKKTQRVSPLKWKKDGPSKASLVNNDTS